MAGGRWSAKVSSRPARKGIAKIKLKKLKPGRYKLSAVYRRASGTAAGSTSKVRTVKVVEVS